MQLRKFITLFAIIGLPPLIYILYVTFAQNHYVSLNYYGEKHLSEEISPDTNLPDTIYYQLDLNEFYDLENKLTNGTLNDQFTVVSFFTGSNEDDKKRLVENYARIRNSFKGVEVVQQLILVPEGSNFEAVTALNDSKIFCIELGMGEMEKMSDKVFFESECPNMDKNCKTMCIVDHERRIRGYFNGVMKKEVDDLMGALRVLKIEYYNEQPNSFE